MSPCHIGPADRRLRDAFHHWRRLENAYFEPYEFRVSLNSFLQEARNVTFILQKNKKDIPRFEEWYSKWQERMRRDPLMKWAVESRNRITKQGDLETESYSMLTFTSDWTDERTREFRARPSVPSTVLIREALARIPSELISEESLFCVERQWIDAALPGNELLGVTSHILIVLSELVHDAHQYIETVVPGHRCDLTEKLDQRRREYPIEIARRQAARRLWVKAERKEELRYTVSSENVTRETVSEETVRERYGLPTELAQRADAESLEGAVAMFTERAKQILAHDGYLWPFIFALDRDRGITFLRLEMSDRAEKHIAIRQAAALLSAMNIDWAILVNEAWWVPLEQAGPLVRHAAHYENRREAIAAEGVSSDGRFCSKHVPFTRQGKKIIFDSEEQGSTPANILLPILKAIRKAQVQ